MIFLFIFGELYLLEKKISKIITMNSIRQIHDPGVLYFRFSPQSLHIKNFVLNALLPSRYNQPNIKKVIIRG